MRPSQADGFMGNTGLPRPFPEVAMSVLRHFRPLLIACALLASSPTLAAVCKIKNQHYADASTAVLNGELREYTIESGLFKGSKLKTCVELVQLDGKYTKFDLLGYATQPLSLQLTPGRHTVDVMFRDGTLYSNGKFWLDAEANKTYTARFSRQGGGLRMWLEDAATHEPVGGIGDAPAERSGVSVVEGEAAVPYDAPKGEPGKRKQRTPPIEPDTTFAVLVSDPGNGPGGFWSMDAPSQRLLISQLDGKSRSHNTNQYQDYQILPGRHEVVVALVDAMSVVNKRLVFDAEAGKTYWVRHRTEGYTADFWIEDGSTGKAISRDADAAPPGTP
jgi:hypothetical protein